MRRLIQLLAAGVLVLAFAALGQYLLKARREVRM